MFEQIIVDYLKTNRRLVIPNLGSFIVKEGGGVVFSELLKRDDGILRSLLISGCGMSELEAAGAIDRFVFEARRSLQNDLVFELRGLGVMTCGRNGTLIFRYQPAPAASSRPEIDAAPNRQDGGDSRATADAPIFEPKVSLSPKVNPEPCLKGLRYGKPQKDIRGYSYVGGKSSRGIDKFLIAGIAAALLAVGAILYGYFSRSEEQIHRGQEQMSTELPVTQAAVEAVPAE